MPIKGAVSKTVKADEADFLYKVVTKRDLLSLMAAYPECIVDIKEESNGAVYAITKSGQKLLYDDKRKKGPEEKLQNPDLQDLLEQKYPLNDIAALMPENYDPGRVRVYPILKEVYGASKERVQSNLISVKAGGYHFQFNRSNHAAEALKKVMEELIPLSNQNVKVRNNTFPTNGTFNYRFIAGTNRLSPHSFGIAIDLVRDKRDYWQWASKAEGLKRLESYPREIVQVFEKHNFIWGGKWAHFDILHFEYRPECILKSKYFPNPPAEGRPWYDGAPVDDSSIRNYIDKIDKAIK